jgi:predicted dehydrogenase
MNEPLRVVLVGCGDISRFWFDSVKSSPDVSIVGLVDLQEAAAQRRKEEYQLADVRIGADIGTMLRVTQPEVVFDCTVPGARASVVLAALERGCHVLSEKPMATSMGEAHRLIGAAKKASRLFAVMQNRRYDHRLRGLRRLLDSGEIGEITTVNGDFYLAPHFGGFRDQMKHVLLLDMAIHSFDQARLLSGGDPVSVYCQEWNPKDSWYAGGASAIAIFELSNGVVYTYRGSWCAEGLGTSWECDWRVVGTRGTATWDGGGEFRAETTDGDQGFFHPVRSLSVPAPETDGKSGHAQCIEEFVRCVRTGESPETICTENIKSLAMVFGAIESAETGKKVAIPL